MLQNANVCIASVAFNGKIYAIGGGKTYPADAFATVEAFTPEISVTAISSQGKLATIWGKIKQKR